MILLFHFYAKGLGKKKVQHQRTSKFTPDFIAWIPHKREIKDAGPVVSVYRETFRNSDKNRVPQVLVPTINKPTKCLSASAPAFLPTPYADPADMVQEQLVTSYQLSHRHQQPNPNVHTNMNTGKVDDNPVPFQKSISYINPRIESIYDRPKHHAPLTSLRRARTGSAPIFRSSVADCMRWHVPQDLNMERPRPKSVAGTFPEVKGAGTNSMEEAQQIHSLQPVPPQTSVKGTICQTTAWGTEIQPMSNQSSTFSMDTRPIGQTQNDHSSPGIGQTQNGHSSGMDMNTSFTQSSPTDAPMAEWIYWNISQTTCKCFFTEKRWAFRWKLVINFYRIEVALRTLKGPGVLIPICMALLTEKNQRLLY